MKIFLPVVFLVFHLSYASAQQEQKVILYNIGFGGVTAGIGSVINKPKGSDWKKQFVKGFWQGSIGGAISYSSKKTLFLINSNQNKMYALPALLLQAAGTSIIENAAFNHPFLQTWKLEHGPFRFDYSVSDKKLKVRVLPVALLAIILAARNSRLDLPITLLSGRIGFQSNDPLIYFNHRYSSGISFGRAFAYANGDDKFHTIAHELIHQYQFSEYLVFNSWLNNVAAKIKYPKLGLFIKKYVYPEVPYAFGAYAIEGFHDFYYHYWRNFFEFEAERMSTNKYVPVN